MFCQPRWVLGSSHCQGQNENACSENTFRTFFKEVHSHFIGREGDGLSFGRMQVLIDYLEKKRSNIRRQVQKVIKIKYPRKLMKEVLLHQDNAPVQNPWLSMATMHNCILNWLMAFLILPIWHHLVLICSPKMDKNICLGTSIAVMMLSYLLMMNFWPAEWKFL